MNDERKYVRFLVYLLLIPGSLLGVAYITYLYQYVDIAPIIYGFIAYTLLLVGVVATLIVRSNSPLLPANKGDRIATLVFYIVAALIIIGLLFWLF